MSLRWPVKDPDETLDFSIDWSRFLEGRTISDVVWYIYAADGTKTVASVGVPVNSLTNLGTSSTSTVTTINLSGGIRNLEYKLSCQITFGPENLISERTVRLPVRDR